MSSILAAMLAASSSPPPDPTTTYVILAAGCIGVMYVMMRVNKRQRRTPDDGFFTRNSLAAERRAQADMENVLVELSKMSRELNAQLDTRAAKIEALIADADERIARLEALLKQAPPRPAFDRPDFARFDAGRSDAASMAAEPLLRLVHPPTSHDAGGPARTVPADDMAPSPTVDAAHAEVYRLADEGRTIPQIATTIDRPAEEVRLMLALRPRN